MDIGVAEEAKGVYLIQVLENLKVGDQRKRPLIIAHLLQIDEVVGNCAPVAQVDIEAKCRIAHLAQLSVNFLEASACGISTADSVAFLIDLDGIRSFFLANEQRQSIDIAWVAASVLHGNIVSAFPRLDKLDTESLVNASHCCCLLKSVNLQNFVLGDDLCSDFVDFEIS